MTEIVKCQECGRRCAEDVVPYSHQYWTCPKCHQIVLRRSIDAMVKKHRKSLERLGGR
jgi:Zn finger protein HypA/HybF involved in hydrogenase expression